MCNVLQVHNSLTKYAVCWQRIWTAKVIVFKKEIVRNFITFEPMKVFAWNYVKFSLYNLWRWEAQIQIFCFSTVIEILIRAFLFTLYNRIMLIWAFVVNHTKGCLVQNVSVCDCFNLESLRQFNLNKLFYLTFR